MIGVCAIRVAGGLVGTNQSPARETADINHLTTGYSVLDQTVLVRNKPTARHGGKGTGSNI